jgi:hypothetical protein
VRNNIFYDMFRTDLDPWQIGAIGGSAVHATSPGGRHLIYNNIIYGSGSEATFFGIGAYYGPDDVKIFNNTIYDLRHPAALAITVDESTATNVMLKNNIAFRTGGIDGGEQESNLIEDPRFCDGAGSDFRLQEGSPAFDRGTPLDEVTTDIVGTPRPQGEGFDIGAYEMWSPDDCSPVAVPPLDSLQDGDSGSPGGGADLAFANPYRPGWPISYSIPRGTRVRLEVFDAAGRRLTTLVDEWQEAGKHRTTWNADGPMAYQVAGIYFVRLSVGPGIGVCRKILLMPGDGGL